MLKKEKDDLLDDWDRLNAFLKTSTEDQTVELTEHEKANRKRPSFVRRLHSRFCRLRRIRERGEM